jgi:hypothetical protein
VIPNNSGKLPTRIFEAEGLNLQGVEYRSERSKSIMAGDVLQINRSEELRFVIIIIYNSHSRPSLLQPFIFYLHIYNYVSLT